uniref:F-box C protein n=1 Tax=Caenorhabditis tropicalis TaxID=1561998 RepID=A0A1I7UXM6_9PELO
MITNSFSDYETRSLSYPALLSLLKNVNYDKRLALSIQSPDIRKIHTRIGYSLNSLSFIQKHGDVNQDGISEEQCDRPFRNLFNLQNLNLNWTLSGVREFPLFQDFPENHIFEKLELSGYGSLLLTEKQVKNCKHLILKKDEIYEEFVIGNEERAIRDYYCNLSNNILEVHLGLNHVQSFLLLCERILLDTFHIGTSFTASYVKTGKLKEIVWNSLLDRFKFSKEGVLNNRDCVVLQEKNNIIVAVFFNYSGDNKDRERFTAVKLKRLLEHKTENFGLTDM